MQDSEIYIPESTGKARTNFVLVLCRRGSWNGFSGAPEFIGIHKDRPAWQAGRINLPGGAIEEGETPEQAAIRELQEETGVYPFGLTERGVMQDRHLKIHCFDSLASTFDFKPREGETEKPVWLSVEEAYVDPRLLPNLRVIIPLLMSPTKGWQIEDRANSLAGPEHSIKVTVPTFSN